MELLVVVGLGLCGAWLTTKLFSCGERAQPRHSGYYLSESYRRRNDRACRPEFVANLELRR